MNPFIMETLAPGWSKMGELLCDNSCCIVLSDSVIHRIQWLAGIDTETGCDLRWNINSLHAKKLPSSMSLKMLENIVSSPVQIESKRKEQIKSLKR